MEPEQPARTPGPCPRCDETLTHGEEQYGPYVNWVHCGKLFDLLAASYDEPSKERDNRPSPVVRTGGRLTGPMTPERRDRTGTPYPPDFRAGPGCPDPPRLHRWRDT